jgi:hypothetical protein
MHALSAPIIKVTCVVGLCTTNGNASRTTFLCTILVRQDSQVISNDGSHILTKPDLSLVVRK